MNRQNKITIILGLFLLIGGLIVGIIYGKQYFYIGRGLSILVGIINVIIMLMKL